MAIIRPFQGMRYNPSLVGDLSAVVSPPYDVISPSERIFYHERHPNNFVRLILGEERPKDNRSNNRFTRSKQYLNQWLRDGVLEMDETPAVYVYEQKYKKAGRTFVIRGFTVLVRIEDYANGVILPHENTLAKPKSDLIKLIRTTQANYDSIYGLYPDPDQEITPMLDNCAAGTPAAEAIDKDSVHHRLWIVKDKRRIAQVAGFLADKEIVIADGHHRYETSLAYRDEMRALDTSANGDKPYDYVLMTIVNVYGKDVTIFPTHRMVGNLPKDMASGLLSMLSSLFNVESVAYNNVTGAMAKRGGKSIGLITDEDAHLLTLRAEPQTLIDKPRALCELDLTILHNLILEDTLEIDEYCLKNEINLAYTRDEEEAKARVRSGEFQMAFLLNPIKVESVLEVARVGEKMPQKATYFYPKLISGLALRKM
ncbi:MAG: DUF1015 domain-containing protein [Armatimonadota bacterium]|nr:DUF1015 domain-containing protein [Armatimonadota bacterium]